MASLFFSFGLLTFLVITSPQSCGICQRMVYSRAVAHQQVGACVASNVLEHEFMLVDEPTQWTTIDRHIGCVWSATNPGP